MLGSGSLVGSWGTMMGCGLIVPRGRLFFGFFVRLDDLGWGNGVGGYIWDRMDVGGR